MKNYLVLVLSMLVACTGSWAQDAPTITVRKSDSVNVNLQPIGGADGAAVTKVIQNDMEVSGVFSVGPAERATYKISGTAAGGRLQVEVLDARGSRVLASTYNGNPRSVAHQFVDDLISTVTGGKGIANSRIAFVSNRSGKKEIYLADYDGANAQQVTRDNAISVAPALSWDGRKLAYTGYHSGYADIYVVDIASGARSRVVKFPGTNSGAAFSPDGNRLACSVSRDGNPELYVIGVNGSGARRLTRTPGVESSPTWSPDGREIIYSSDDRGGPQLFRISSNGGSGQLIRTGHGYCTEPSWSPDGSKVAYNVRSGGNFAIAVTDLRSGQTRIVAPRGEDPVWGPNSRHLIYSSGSSIVLLDTQNGRSWPVVTGLGQVSEPTWSR